jgi:amidase
VDRAIRCAGVSLSVAVTAVSTLSVAADGPQAQSSFHLEEATVESIHSAMLAGKLTCPDLVKGYLARIEAYDRNGPKLNGVQTVNPLAMQTATDLDAKLQATGVLSGPLHCIPVMLKDQIETTWMPTTYGSALFKNFVAQRNATIVDKIMSAGGIILAKTNLGEFAAGGSGSAFGDCRNVYNPLYYASGSSCGTGVTVAANMGAVGIGEDTAGSLRGPASHESLVGLRPTMGLVSRYAVLPQAPSRDTLGPITRTVRDAAVVLDVIAGYDPKDPITAESVDKIPKSYTAYLDKDGLRGKRFAVIRTALYGNADISKPDYKEVQDIVTQAVADIRARGAEVIDPIVIPGLLELVKSSDSDYETNDATDAYFAELKDPPVKTYRELGESQVVIKARRDSMAKGSSFSLKDPAYAAALKKRIELRTAIYKAMADNKLDGFIYPPFDHAPPLLPGITAGSNRLMSTFLGWPSIVLPAGFTTNGLPIGIEILARPWEEGLLLKAGYDYEQSTRRRRPSPVAPPLTNELEAK